MKKEVNRQEEKMEKRRASRQLLRWGLFTLALSFVTVVGLFVVSGCGNQPTAPSPVDLDVQNRLSDVQFFDSLYSPLDGKLDRGPLPFGLSDSLVATGEAVLGVKGGKITVEFADEEVVFHVPKGALTADVGIQITGRKYVFPEGDVYVYECSPSGLQFLEPIWVDHPINHADGESAFLFYNADDNGTENCSWELVQVAKVNNHKARFLIHHFSKYGIS